MDRIPNIISGFRLIAAPLLLYLAWAGYRNYFLILLAVSLLSDAMDGYIARKLNVSSDIGSKLDSWGDLATYLIIPLCAWWLWPEKLKQEAFFVLLAIGAFIVPLIAGVAKFHKLPSYHTWGAKTAAILMGVTIFILLISDISWPFRCAALFQVLVACEEIAITMRLSELQSNVRSFWHVIQIKNEEE